MRLGTLLLTGAALVGPSLLAQGHASLPWERLLPLDWQVGPGPVRNEGPGGSGGLHRPPGGKAHR